VRKGVEGEGLGGPLGRSGKEWSNCGEVGEVVESLCGGQGWGVGLVGRLEKGERL